jgi:hypothetical protein
MIIFLLICILFAICAPDLVGALLGLGLIAAFWLAVVAVVGFIIMVVVV